MIIGLVAFLNNNFKEVYYIKSIRKEKVFISKNR